MSKNYVISNNFVNIPEEKILLTIGTKKDKTPMNRMNAEDSYRQNL